MGAYMAALAAAYFWLFIWIWFVILPIVSVPLFSWPLCLVLHRGVAAAREPERRVTPLGAWQHFFQAVGPQLRRMALLWFILFAELTWTVFSIYRFDDDLTKDEKAQILVSIVIHNACQWALTASACLLLAPRFKSSLASAVAGSAMALGLFAGCTLGLQYFASLQNGTRGAAMAVLGSTVLGGTLVWIRRGGDRWFRFEY